MTQYRIDRDYSKLYEWDDEANAYLYVMSIADVSMSDSEIIEDYET